MKNNDIGPIVFLLVVYGKWGIEKSKPFFGQRAEDSVEYSGSYEDTSYKRMGIDFVLDFRELCANGVV